MKVLLTDKSVPYNRLERRFNKTMPMEVQQMLHYALEAGTEKTALIEIDNAYRYAKQKYPDLFRDEEAEKGAKRQAKKEVGKKSLFNTPNFFFVE